MKKILIVTTYKRLLIGLTLLVFVSIPAYILFIDISSWKHVQTLQIKASEEMKQLIEENERMRGMLSEIFPREQKVMYEDEFRSEISAPTVQPTALQEVIDKGKDIWFQVEYKVPMHLRTIYNPRWSDFYFRGWIDLPRKVTEARHRLFVFPIGGSSNFDFMGRLSLAASSRVDTHRNINFLIYHFDVEAIKVLGHQVALVGIPSRTGKQVISIIQDKLLPENENEAEFLFQLSTPEGDEIDYIYWNVIRHEYLKKQIEENTAKPTFFSKQGEMTLEQLKQENKLLKDQLSKFIPLQGEVLTEKECRSWPGLHKTGETLDIAAACDKGKQIEYKLHYRNGQYRRPVYHPLWKKNAAKGWSYVPAKVCENLHTLFSLPSNPDRRSDFLGRLGFFEKYRTISDDEVGLLIYHFTVHEVIKYNNQIIMTGVPTRKGVEIISVDKNLLLNQKSYLVQLATFDRLEVDYDILTVE